MIKTRDIQWQKTMVSEVGASHANETDEEHNILDMTHFRHGMATIGFHTISIRPSRHRDIL
eukprot:8193688-Heterocapsa_arctica.AAC.1